MAALMCGGAAADDRRELRVSGAVSLRAPLHEIVTAFERQFPEVRVELNLAGTNTLVRQITEGARRNVLVAADRWSIERLIVAGRVAPGAAVAIARNELVVAVPAGSALTIQRIEDLAGPEFQRIALCNEAVPLGRYARETLARRGLLNALLPRCIRVDHARAALAAVESGAVDAAILYRSDAAASQRCRIAFVPPADEQPDVQYWATVVGTSADADAFVGFLRTEAARAALLRAGVSVPPREAATSAPGGDAPFRADELTEGLSGSIVLEIAGRTLLVAGVATLAVLPPGVAIALLLARGRFAGRSVLQAFVTLPMVLPPVAVGLLLLKLLSPQRPWAGPLNALFGGELLFTWRAAAIASAVMGAPLLIRTAEAAFASVPRRLELIASSLGNSPARVFFTVTLPLASRGVAYGVLLCFLRALGEFGATTLVAGNIVGRTETLALAIYSRTENQQDGDALVLALIAVVVAVAATVAGERFLRRPGSAERVR